MQPSADQLRSAPANVSAHMGEQDYAQLTYQDLLPETLALVQQLVAGRTNAYDRVRALESHLQGSDFEYSRVLPVLPGKNPIDAFVLRERRGHCQLFASALALMARSLGIPARVVSGYRGGTWEASDQSYTITEDMAHLWVEVYFADVGWITFDPSPMDREEDAFTFSTITRAYSRYVLRARLAWLRNVVAFQQRDRNAYLRDFSARLFRAGGDTWDRIQSPDHRISMGGVTQQAIIGVAVFGAIGALVWVVLRGRTPSRARRLILSQDQRRAMRMYARLRRRLRRLGIACEGRTAEEIVEASLSVPLNDMHVVDAAVALYNDVRFGRKPLSAGELSTWNRRIARLSVIDTAPSPVTAG